MRRKSRAPLNYSNIGEKFSVVHVGFQIRTCEIEAHLMVPILVDCPFFDKMNEMFDNVVLGGVDNQFVQNSLPQKLCTARMSVGATFPQ